MNEIRIERFLEVKIMRARIMNDTTGTDFITSIKGARRLSTCFDREETIAIKVPMAAARKKPAIIRVNE